MSVILKQIFNLIKLLHSDTGTTSISWGVAMGFILGMTPAFSLQTVLVFILLFIFRIQIGAAFLTAFFFKFIAFFLDPIFHTIGSSVLEMDSLRGLFTEMYNMPIVPLTRFYNSIVMGSGVISVFLIPVVFYTAKYMIIKYRVTVVARVQNTKYWKLFKATTFYKWYTSYDNLYGGAE
ncbi:MAG: TIGR03546 family protein [Bdellovibrionaceae bacterium]|nr:TIGR03546 family protein [Pseudobdellovibrionaceae bacterium]